MNIYNLLYIWNSVIGNNIDNIKFKILYLCKKLLSVIIVNDNDRKYIILLKIRLLSKGILLIKGINNSNTYIVLNDTIKMNNVIILYINQFLSFILKKIFSDVCSNS